MPAARSPGLAGLQPDLSDSDQAFFWAGQRIAQCGTCRLGWALRAGPPSGEGVFCPLGSEPTLVYMALGCNTRPGGHRLLSLPGFPALTLQGHTDGAVSRDTWSQCRSVMSGHCYLSCVTLGVSFGGLSWTWSSPHILHPSKTGDRSIPRLCCEIPLGDKTCSAGCFVVKIHSGAGDMTLLVEFLLIMLKALGFHL